LREGGAVGEGDPEEGAADLVVLEGKAGDFFFEDLQFLKSGLDGIEELSVRESFRRRPIGGDFSVGRFRVRVGKEGLPLFANGFKGIVRSGGEAIDLVVVRGIVLFSRSDPDRSVERSELAEPILLHPACHGEED